MMVYVLTVDGYADECYGSEIYLVGVFDSMEKAKAAQNTIDEAIREFSDINEVELNNVYEVIKTENFGFRTKYNLGGYIE